MTAADESTGDRGKEDHIGIRKWLTGRSVLVTGATGFVGSVLCEKLVHSCPGLVKVYCLVRGRKGVSAQTRMQETLHTPLFKTLTAEAKKKIIVIEADITEPGLNLSDADRRTLQSDVSATFHVAASTNFSSPLPQAARINLLATQYVLEFTKSCPKAQCFLYVSTAYCNSMVRGPTMETIYPNCVSPQELLELVKTKELSEDDVKDLLGGHSNTYSFTKQLAEEMIRMEKGSLPVAIVRPSLELVKTKELSEDDAKGLLGGHSNTYSFTKQLAEEMIRMEKGSLPVAIVRPSLVLACHSEPVPGWLSNVLNGGVAFIAGAGKGIFRIVVGYPEIVADIVPVDFVCNQCITAAWDVAHNPPANGLKVSHCVSGTSNPVTWGQYCDLVVEAARKNPSQELAYYPAAKCRAHPLRVLIFVYLFQLLPCYLLQPIESLFRANRPIIQYQQKFIRGMQYVRFFTTRFWTFDDRQRRMLEEKLTGEEKEIFNFDVKRIHWPSYFETNVLGVRHFYHKDSPSTLKSSRKLIPFFLCIHIGAYFALFYIASFIIPFFHIYGIGARLLALAVTAFVWWF